MTTEPSVDTAYSVCYRTGPLTDADYDEAIEALRNAKEHDQSKGCTVCSDSGHGAETCHHNPLVLARRWARATSVWVCWHCGFEATNTGDARAHFGLGEEHEPKCLTSLSRQVEELRKALEPFAVYADPYNKVPGNLQITNGSVMAKKQLTMSDCYTARTALALAEERE